MTLYNHAIHPNRDGRPIRRSQKMISFVLSFTGLTSIAVQIIYFMGKSLNPISTPSISSIPFASTSTMRVSVPPSIEDDFSDLIIPDDDDDDDNNDDDDQNLDHEKKVKKAQEADYYISSNDEKDHEEILDSAASSHIELAKNDTVVQNDSDTTTTSSRKDWLIIHIGPSKTGTTSIQKGAVAIPEILKSDNYIYKGRYGKGELPLIPDMECLLETVQYLKKANASSSTLIPTVQMSASDVPCWNKTKYAGVQRKQKNVFASDEAYSYKSNVIVKFTVEDLSKLRKVLEQEWNVRFVATYRRYIEWIVSANKEINSKLYCIPKEKLRSPQWFNATNQKKSGSPCQSFWRWYRVGGVLASPTQYSTGFYMNIKGTVSKLRDAGFDVSILNMHDEKDIVESLWCDVIPNAPNTCQHFRAGEVKKHNEKSDMIPLCSNLVYDAEKIGVYERGHGPEARTREDAIQECVEFLKENDISRKDLPLICPKQEGVEKLLNKTLAFEEMMVPDFFRSEMGETKLREEFHDFVIEKKGLCDLNHGLLLDGAATWNEVKERILSRRDWAQVEYKK